MPDAPIKDQLVSDHAELYDTLVARPCFAQVIGFVRDGRKA
jgi:hypothetical protein